MNIFILSEDPVEAARMQCDKHVVKMCLETAQILCTVFPPEAAPYRRSHYNHPCCKWARSSVSNYRWLINHGLALCEEYTKRYNKIHKSREIIEWCRDNYEVEMFYDCHEPTPFAQAMPEEYYNESAVVAYRSYYIGEKKSIAKWNKATEPPEWWIQDNQDV